MLNTILLVILAAGLLVALFFIYTVARRLDEMRHAQTNDKSLLMLNQNLVGMNEKLDKTNESIHERLTNAAKVISAVQKELGTVQERFKGFEEFNDLLHPKMRGNIGEQILSDMLAQVFPQEMYELQWKFKDGSTVDAAIKTRAGIVPVDSKFPLEGFKNMNHATSDAERLTAAREFYKHVKKHIDDIAKKYILPDEGTVNFAVMYVPSENIYYHLLTDEEFDVLEYARGKNVILTSPHGFFGFLRVVLVGLERNRLQAQAQKIWDVLKGVQQETVKFGDELSVLSRHLTNAKNSMDNVNAKYDRLSGKLEQVKLIGETGDEGAIEQ